MYPEKQIFEIKYQTENQLFTDPVTQSILKTWCEKNDTIKPIFLDRESWEHKSKNGILQEQVNDVTNLYIPKDLQLWEVADIVKAIDLNTFQDNPEIQSRSEESIMELGQKFQNSGIYIAKRLDAITDGKEIAEQVAKQFYKYGKSLTDKVEAPEVTDLSELANQELTELDNLNVDIFLSGDDLFISRSKRVADRIAENPDNSDEIIESERRHTLAQFFHVSKMAFDLESKDIHGYLRQSTIKVEPWVSKERVHHRFIEDINQNIKNNINLPEQQIDSTIFSRGINFLQKEIGFDTMSGYSKSIIPGLEIGEKQLRKALGIDRLKQELIEARKTKSNKEVANIENEIADNIQIAIANYRRIDDNNYPLEMKNTQMFNCVGRSILGGALLSDVGINCLTCQAPSHSFLWTINSDDKIEWRDMTNTNAEKVTDSMINNVKSDGTKLTVQDIIEFSKHNNEHGLEIDFSSDKFKDRLRYLKGHEKKSIKIYSPEVGQKLQVLNNLGVVYKQNNEFEKSVQTFEKCLQIEDNDADILFNYADSLDSNHQDKQAILVLQKIIGIDDKYLDAYKLLGYIFQVNRRLENAEKAYQQYLALKFYNKQMYNDSEAVSIVTLKNFGIVQLQLGHFEDAIRTYERINNDNPNSKDYTPYYYIGCAYEQLNKYDEAEKAYRIFNEKQDENSPDIWNMKSGVKKSLMKFREIKDEQSYPAYAGKR